MGVRSPRGLRATHPAADLGAQAEGTSPVATDKTLAKVARGSTLNVVGAAFSALGTIAVTVLVTRFFSKVQAGAFFSATSLFLIVEQATGLGAYVGAVYFIARLRPSGDEARISRVVRAAAVPVVVASVTAAVALLLFATPIAGGLAGGQLAAGGAPATAMATALRALAVTLPFATLADTFLGATRGYGDMRPTVVVRQLGRSALQLAGVGGAALLGSTALLAPFWALPYIPAAAGGWLWLRHIRAESSVRRRPAPAPEPPATESELAPEARPAAEVEPEPVGARRFWSFTTPRSLATMAQIIVQRLDIVLVGIMRGPADAAIYTAATRFLVAGQLGSVAISSATQPQFTELFAFGAKKRANGLYQITTAWLILLTWPIYLLMLVDGVKFLSIFGHSYKAGLTVLVILALTMLLSAACGQVDVVLITAGKSSWSMVNGLLAMGVNVGVDLALIPRYGITGAAIGWSAAIVVANLMPLVQLAVSLQLTPLSRAVPIACGLSVLSFLALPLAARAAAGYGALGILSGIAAGAACMAAGLWYFRDVLCLLVMPGVSRFVKRA